MCMYLSDVPLACVHPFLTESLDNTNMKEIKGLDERLAGLQQILQNVQTLTQSQADMAQGFQKNQVRALNIGDPSVLPDLCTSHQKQLMMLTKNHSHLRFVLLLRSLRVQRKSRAFCNKRLSTWLAYGQGGYLGFQVTRMIEWEQTSRPKKIPRASNKTKNIPGPKTNSPKIPCRISDLRN